MNNIFTKFTKENKCSCGDFVDLDPVKYTDPKEIKTMYQKAKKSEESFSECIYF